MRRGPPYFSRPRSGGAFLLPERTTLMMTEPIALGVPAAADLLGVGRDVIRDHCNRGTLKARKIGARWSILRADLLAWYAAQPSNHADDDRLADA